MQKWMMLLSLIGLVSFATAQTVPTRIELAHKCYQPMADKNTAGKTCVAHSKHLKMLNTPGAPFQIEAFCTEVVELAIWEELGCPGPMGDRNEGGFYIEAYVNISDIKAVKGKYFDLAVTERSKLFNCPDFTALLKNFSTDAAIISARCETLSALKYKVISGIEIK